MDPLFVTLMLNQIDPNLTADRVMAQLEADWGKDLALEYESYGVDVLPAEADSEADTESVSLVFRFDDTFIVASRMTLDGEVDIAEAADDSPLWDQSLTLPDGSGDALVVTAVALNEIIAVDEETLLESESDPVQEAVLISRVVASIVSCTDSLSGIFMVSSELLATPEAYRKAALDVAPSLPLILWVDLMVTEDSGLSAAETYGLASLGLYEVEIAASSLPVDDVAKVLVDTAVMIYDEGPVVQDGDVVETAVGNMEARVGLGKYEDEETRLYLTPIAPPANRAERRAAERKKN